MSVEAVPAKQGCCSFTQHILKENNFICVRYWLNELTGMNIEDFGRFTLQARLTSCADRLGVANVNKLVEFLGEQTSDFSHPCWQAMLDAALETESWFRREARHFNFLRQIVLPELPENCKILSAGCGKGEEAFDIAFECAEHFGVEAGWQIQGVDIRADAIESARSGWWKIEDYAAVSEEHLTKYFEPCSHGVKVKRTIQSKMNFRCDNLLHNDENQVYDAVFCRNLLVDMEKRSGQSLINNMMRSLKPGGYLLVSHSEKLVDYVDHTCLVSPHIVRKI